MGWTKSGERGQLARHQVRTGDCCRAHHCAEQCANGLSIGSETSQEAPEIVAEFIMREALRERAVYCRKYWRGGTVICWLANDYDESQATARHAHIIIAYLLHKRTFPNTGLAALACVQRTIQNATRPEGNTTTSQKPTEAHAQLPKTSRRSSLAMSQQQPRQPPDDAHAAGGRATPTPPPAYHFSF